MRSIRREIKFRVVGRSFYGVLKDLSSLTYSLIHNRVGLLPYITNYHWLVELPLIASKELAGRTGTTTARRPIEPL